MDTRRRLLRFLLLWIVIGAGAAAGAVRLVERVSLTDHTPAHFYSQPSWSADETQVAYFGLTAPYGSSRPDPTTVTTELWRVDRQSGAPIKITDFPPGRYRLAGWFQHDKEILVLSDQAAGGTPGDARSTRVYLVEVSNGKTEELPYLEQHLRLVGISEGQLFFEQVGEQTGWAVASSELSPTPSPSPSTAPTPTPEVLQNPLKRPQAILLSWSSASSGFHKVLGIPYENEALSIDEAVPSPDSKWLALVLKVGDAGKERALWLYEHPPSKGAAGVSEGDGGHLSWSGIRVAADSMKLAWSPDSKGLVASSHSQSFCDLYVAYDIAKADFHKLRSASGPLASGVEPFWPRDQHYFWLLRGGEAFQFDPTTRQATPLQLRSMLDHQVRDLSISPRGTWAAYRSTSDGQDELSCVSLSTKQSHLLVGDTGLAEVKEQWWYILGDGLRQAWGYWTGARL